MLIVYFVWNEMIAVSMSIGLQSMSIVRFLDVILLSSALPIILSLDDFDLGGASAKFCSSHVFLAFPLPRPTIPFPKIFVTLVSR